MNIILVGFMACGKTTVGRLLAEKIGYTFADTDALIEAQAGMSIPDIFAALGEGHFRKYEADVCQLLLKHKGTVVSTGGGIVINANNRTLLRKAGKVIYLTVTPEQVMERVKDYTTRPMINYPDPVKRLRIVTEMLAKRDPMYTNTADLTVPTITGNPEQTVDEIVAFLKVKK